jgi:hypothetical protein
MPWKRSDATKHTKKATSDKAKRMWASVANEVLHRTGDEGRAVRTANAVVARLKAKRRRET